jgi:hypothetical protein
MQPKRYQHTGDVTLHACLEGGNWNPGAFVAKVLCNADGTISTALRTYTPTHRPFQVPVWLQECLVHREATHVFVTSRRQLSAFIDIYGKSGPLTRIRNIITYISARLPNPIAESSRFCAGPQCEGYHNRSIPHQNTTATCHILYNFSFTNHYVCTA